MFGLSKMWVKLALAAALVLALLGAVRGVYSWGYGARDKEAVIDAARAQAHADKAQGALKGDLDRIRSAQEQERKSAKQDIDSLRAQLAAGTVRLRIPVAPGGVVRGPATRLAEARPQPGQAAPAGPAPEPSGVIAAVVELDPATSIELLSIAADGDAAIRDLNECLDSYEALRKRLHGLQRTD